MDCASTSDVRIVGPPGSSGESYPWTPYRIRSKTIICSASPEFRSRSRAPSL